MPPESPNGFAIDSKRMTGHPHPDPDLIVRLRTAIGAAPRVRLAVLFGSSVSGRTRPDSDVDVAILTCEFDPDDSFEVTLSRELTLAARTEVDLIRLENASTVLKWQIATGGVLLVEKSPHEFARFRARAASEYIEYAPALAYYGEVFRRRLIEQARTR
jgi:predicted nucleotidyltransferase